MATWVREGNVDMVGCSSWDGRSETAFVDPLVDRDPARRPETVRDAPSDQLVPQADPRQRHRPLRLALPDLSTHARIVARTGAQRQPPNGPERSRSRSRATLA